MANYIHSPLKPDTLSPGGRLATQDLCRTDDKAQLTHFYKTCIYSELPTVILACHKTFDGLHCTFSITFCFPSPLLISTVPCTIPYPPRFYYPLSTASSPVLPAGSGSITGPAALAAAISAWSMADTLVKQRYHEKETAEKQRYERELKAWIERPEDAKLVETSKALDLKKVRYIRLVIYWFLIGSLIMQLEFMCLDAAYQTGLVAWHCTCHIHSL